MNTNPNAKKVLIYGDSLTWGKVPGSRDRFPIEKRFPGVMQDILSNSYEIIEAGMGGRMAYGEHPSYSGLDGFKHFPIVYSMHLPIDILVIFLGANDLNSISSKSAEQIVGELEKYINLTSDITKSLCSTLPTKIVYISPPIIQEACWTYDNFLLGAEAKSRQMAKLLAAMIERNNANFFYAAKVVETSMVDGVHLDEKNNKILGTVFAEYIANF